jgi:hypothetical protein
VTIGDANSYAQHEISSSSFTASLLLLLLLLLRIYIRQSTIPSTMHLFLAYF